MLIDTLLRTRIENVVDSGMPPLRYALARATKFELGSDFAAAADALSNDFTAVEKALPFCRLPFPLTWIEVAQQHRPHFARAPTHMPAVQRAPLRVGFLLHATNEELSEFDAFQFWELREMPGRGQASHLSMHYDPKMLMPKYPDEGILGNQPNEYIFVDPGVAPGWSKASLHVRARLVACVQPGTAPYIDPVLGAAIALADTTPQGRYIFEAGVCDWSGESMFVLAALALMNTVNVTEVKRVDKTKLNARRAKERKPPFAEHSVLTIHPRIREHMVGKPDAHGHRELTGHLVRGHFKVRRTGVFFWHPHARGKRKEEATPKTYHVE